MKVLAMELSTGRGSVAWFDAKAETFSVEFPNDRKHSGAFFEQLQHCLEQCGTPELIVVGLGPGSYAGTRIAIATATGLQIATGAKLIGVSSVRAFETDAEQYSVVGDARRQSFFVATIARRECIAGPLLCTRDELLARLQSTRHPVFASEQLIDAPDARLAFPAARVLAQIGAAGGSSHIAAPLEPIYLRAPHITQPRGAVLPKAHR